MSRRLAFCAGLLLSASFPALALADSGQELQIVVSKNQQMLNVYDGDRIVATSRVSTGKEGHDTPSGIFTILEKQKYHRSNIYSNAPMPWMQRITWSGVALHESNSVPNRPASHGCVRLPAAFAKELFKMTSRGASVVIADDLKTPTLLASQSLLQPRRSPQSPSFMDDVAMRPTLETSGKADVEVAMADSASLPKQADVEKDRAPIHIMITRTDGGTNIRDVQQALTDLNYNPGDIDGFMGPMTRDAVAKFRLDNGLATGSGTLDDGLITLLFIKAHIPLPQNGIVMVRQNFQEIYRAPVTIEDPKQALGTHYMVARNVDPSDRAVQWYGMSLENHIPSAAMKRLGIETAEEPIGIDPQVAAFERIKMTDEIRKKLEELLADGSSLTITDVESRSETGLGTNFVTITHPGPRG
jgi:peptidoglycan hydrolase-like protein with peptidoglycan-binding domain